MVARAEDSHQPDNTAEMLAKFQEAIADKGLGELKQILAALGVLGGPGADSLAALDSFAAMTPPSQRRPRRDDVVTYRVRVDLTWTKPPLWRRFELASDLFLDDLHEVLQVAFGWTDSHLHRFGCGGTQFYSYKSEHYLSPYDVEEGEVGVPEEQVRLDEVLVDVGDKLFYLYDFGDDWHHTIKLESVLPRDESAPRAVCTTGRREGPAEDCGGVYGYELLAAGTDPAHPHHADVAAEFASVYGEDGFDPADFAPTPFDRDDINELLAEIAPSATPGATGDATAASFGQTAATALPAPLEELVGEVRTAAGRRELRRLMAEAAWDEPVRVDAETAARMVRSYTWLLDRVGPDGIKLTSAGYLPPAHVEAAMVELELRDEWIGKGNQENLTLPVLNLRESAQKSGLLRKYRGSVLLSSRGRSLRTDPSALWWHLAERMPLPSKDAVERQAGLLLLVAVAAELGDDLDATVARFLDAIGWINSDGTRLTNSMAIHVGWDTWAILRRLGGYASERGLGRRDRPTADGVAFARAALQTWPA